MKLSNKALVKLAYAYPGTNKQDIRWDEAQPAFGVRIYPTGSMSYVVAYRELGKSRITAFAKTSDLSVEDARRRAQELLTQARTGQRTVRVHSTRGLSVEKLFETYKELRIDQMKSGDQEEARIRRRILPTWGKARVQDIGPTEVMKLHREITDAGSPVEANRVVETWRRMINRGKEWRLLPADFENPVDLVQLNTEQARQRWVDPGEMPDLLRGIMTIESVYSRSALLLYLLIGLRKRQLLSLRREGLDHHMRQQWVGPFKSEEGYWLPLPDLAYELLCALPEVEGNPYFFVGRKRGHHLVNIYRSWRGAKWEAEINDVTIHDLRRTLGSWLANNGASLELIGAVLNHRDKEATAIYARFHQSTVQVALNQNAERIRALLAPDAQRRKLIRR